MKTGSIMMLVGLNCPKELDEKFNEWYEEHISLILKGPGVKAAIRYKITEANAKYPYYLATYEFEDEKAFSDYEHSPEYVARHKRSDEWWQGGASFERKWKTTYKVIKTWAK